MNFNEALRELLAEARQPREVPEGWHRATEKELLGDLVQEAQHEALSEAQQVVARWVWERCGRHIGGHFEAWESGFLFDWRPSNELVIWVRVALVHEEFRSRHPSADLEAALGAMLSLSFGLRPDRAVVKRLGRKRFQEIRDLWEGDFPSSTENDS